MVFTGFKLKFPHLHLDHFPQTMVGISFINGACGVAAWPKVSLLSGCLWFFGGHPPGCHLMAIYTVWCWVASYLLFRKAAKSCFSNISWLTNQVRCMYQRYTYIHIYVYIYICISICMYIYIYNYTHVHRMLLFPLISYI